MTTALSRLQLDTLLVSFRTLLSRGDIEQAADLWCKQPVDLNVVFDTERTILTSMVEEENIPGIQFCLERGVDPNFRSAKHFTPLYSAIMNGNAKSVQALLEGGADPNLHDSLNSFDPPISIAVFTIRLPMVQLLLDHGAQVDILDTSGKTPLMWSCSRGFIEATRLLLEWGANTQIKDHQGLSARDHTHACSLPGGQICDLLVGAHDAKRSALSALSSLADFPNTTVMRPS